NSDFIASNQIASFKQIQNITGGSNSDIFIFGTSGSIVGTLDGGNGTNTLVAKNKANEWDINEANEGALYLDNLGAGFENAYVTEFSNIQNLTGNADNDLFVFGANGAVSGTVDGGDNGSVSTNKLIAHGVASEWDISGENAGTLHLDDAGADGFEGGKVAGFTQVQNITGGSAGDIFVFGTNGKTTGQLDGGTGGTNTLQRTNTSIANDWILASSNGGTLNGAIFSNINEIIGSSTVADTLTGQDAGSTWIVTDKYSGEITGSIEFSEIENLVGGTGNDTFDFSDNSNNAEMLSINGVAGDNTLIGRNEKNLWDISNSNSGVLTQDVSSGDTYVHDFSFIHNLTGSNSHKDIFTLSQGGSISGTIDGKGGDDVLERTNSSVGNEWSLTSAYHGELNGGLFANIELLIGSEHVADTLTGFNEITEWDITGKDTGKITNVIEFEEFDKLVGGNKKDTFNFTETYSSIANIDGGGDEENVLNARDTVNEWSIDGNDTGILYQDDSSSSANMYVERFSNIQHVVGGDESDIFKLTGAAGSVDLIDGGDSKPGSNVLFASASVINEWIDKGGDTGTINQTPPSGTLYTTEFVQIQQFVGSGTEWVTIATPGIEVDISTYYGFAGIKGNGDNTLVGDSNFDNEWFIGAAETGETTDAWFDGVNDGWYVNDKTKGLDPGGPIYFIDFENIKGGSEADTFTVTSDSATISSIHGGGGINELVSFNTDTLWKIDNANAGSVLNNTTPSTPSDVIGQFTDIQYLIGGTSTDTFQFTTNNASIVNIDGGDIAFNEIIGRDGVNHWSIGSENGGVIYHDTAFAGNEYVETFSNIQNLTGGNQSDSFTLSELGSHSGMIDGVAGVGVNTLQRTNTSSANEWLLTSLSGGQLNSATDNFNNIDNIIGSASVADTLTGTIDNTDWNIDAENAGYIESGIVFSEIENLVGGEGVDTFTFTAGASLESIQGGAVENNKIVALNVENIWVIDAANGGALYESEVTASNAYVGQFSEIQNLTGGTGSDLFDIQEGGSHSGIIDGGTGLGFNTLQRSNSTGSNEWLLTDDFSGHLNSATENFVSIDEIIGSSSVSDTLTGTSNNSDWDISAENKGNIDGSILFSEIEHLVGGEGVDTFTFTEQVASVESLDGGQVDANEIIAFNIANTWSIDTLNSGTVYQGDVSADNASVRIFSNIQNVTGGTETDTFLFTTT
ncbi:MAG: hypothetical protein GY787_09220, partial [Alteromonadales bacterium]|nr:hypothetical protein [Alteromonadales bacterium]